MAYQCYVISLTRLPRKYPGFLARNGATGLDFKRFDGVDGQTLTLAEAIGLGVINPNATGYTQGMIGCAASHLQLWKQARDSGENILIFEDDAYCRWDIQRRLGELLGQAKNWDIILLGYNTNAVLDVRITDNCNFAGFFSNQNPTPAQLGDFQATKDDVTLVRLNNAFGCCSYLVSPRGAGKLIDAFPMDNRLVAIPGNQLIKSGKTTFRCITGDMIMNTLYRNIDAHAVVPPLVIPLHDHAASTTHGSG
jgi:GR25 family glycosyltransferase involved in LPS biosynthesis